MRNAISVFASLPVGSAPHRASSGKPTRIGTMTATLHSDSETPVFSVVRKSQYPRVRRPALFISLDDQDTPAVPRSKWIRREAAPQDALAFAAFIPNGIRTASAAIFTLGGAVERSDWGKASQARSLAASNGDNQCTTRSNVNSPSLKSTGTTSFGPNLPCRIILETGFSMIC